MSGFAWAITSEVFRATLRLFSFGNCLLIAVEIAGEHSRPKSNRGLKICERVWDSTPHSTALSYSDLKIQVMMDAITSTATITNSAFRLFRSGRRIASSRWGMSSRGMPHGNALLLHSEIKRRSRVPTSASPRLRSPRRVRARDQRDVTL